MEILDPIEAKKLTVINLFNGVEILPLPAIFFSTKGLPIAANREGMDILQKIRDNKELITKMFVDLSPGGLKHLSTKIRENEYSITVSFFTSMNGKGLGYVAVFKNITSEGIKLSAEELKSMRESVIKQRRLISNIMLTMGTLKMQDLPQKTKETLEKALKELVTIFNNIEAILNRVSNRE